jgi:hypothetical protein
VICQTWRRRLLALTAPKYHCDRAQDGRGDTMRRYEVSQDLPPIAADGYRQTAQDIDVSENSILTGTKYRRYLYCGYMEEA